MDLLNIIQFFLRKSINASYCYVSGHKYIRWECVHGWAIILNNSIRIAF